MIFVASLSLLLNLYRISISNFDNVINSGGVKIQIEEIELILEEIFNENNIENYLATMEYEYSELHWPNEPIKYYANTWDDVTKSIYNDSDFNNQIYKTNHYADDLAVVLASAKTENEKILAIFELVKQKIKWNNYNGFKTFNGTKKAYKEGVGNAADINLNLVSMLNTAGFNANPVLISTRSHGIPLYPTIDGFNFVIAAVELNNSIVLLDATDPNCTPNNLPLRDLNWQGRLIRENESSISVDLIPAEASETSSTIMVMLNEFGELSGMERKTYTNLNAVNYRENYFKVKDDDITVKIEDKYKIEIEELRTISLATPEGSKEIVVGRSAELKISDDKSGITLMTANIPYGSKILVSDKDKLKKGDVICKWDPYNAVIISEFDGSLKFNNLSEGVTYREEVDEQTGFTEIVIKENRDKKTKRQKDATK